MLIRREGPSVDVDIGVDFNGCDVKAAGLQDRPDTAGDDAFADPRDHTSCDQNVLHSGDHRTARQNVKQKNDHHVERILLKADLIT